MEGKYTWARRDHSKPIGTLVGFASISGNASLLPHRVGAVIEQLAGRTLTLLSDKDAVDKLAFEIKGRIIEAYFVIPPKTARVDWRRGT